MKRLSELQKRARSTVIAAAEKAWEGRWWADPHEPGVVRLVGQFPVVIRYEEGPDRLNFTIETKQNKNFCTLLQHFLNGGT